MRFLDRLRFHASVIPDRPAALDESRCIRYRELFDTVKSTAGRLHQLGINPDSVVGVTVADEIDHLSITLSLMALGATHVVLATHDSPHVRRELAIRARASHVLATDEEFTIDGARFINLTGPEYVSTKTVPPPELDLNATLYLKTSGATGDMNLIPLSESHLGIQARRLEEDTPPRLMRFASIEHNNSKRHRLYCTWNGGTNIFRPGGNFDTGEFCGRMEVNCLDIARIHAADLIEGAKSTSLAGIKLRTGGSAIPFDIRRALIEKVTPDLHVRYAATECGPISNAGRDDHDIDEPVGRLYSGLELEIVGPRGPVPPGEAGEIRLRGSGMATTYLDNPDATADRFRNGWFYPGDVGVVRTDGQLIVKGRKDDMMILNGLNIFPVEIERILERHPSVATAAALPIASRVHGQIPVAAVELRPNTKVTPAELQRYAREYLALRTPRRILVMDKLPRNSQGKVTRREIAAAFVPGASNNG